ncbi:MAG TPA: hypothetical protein VN900_17455 [Stellaceae bacterium]|jgi:hypothetical protein|nr:hypothetical protein [Stellaceae bacterium]
MSIPHVTAIGFSHLQAILVAQQIREAERRATFALETLTILPPSNPAFVPWCEHVDGQCIYNEQIGWAAADAVKRNSSALVVMSFWSNQHFFLSISNDPRRFDFVLPHDDDLPIDPEAELVPFDLMKKMMSHIFKETLGLVDFLQQFYAGPAVVTAAPPPVDDVVSIVNGTSSPELDEKVRQLGYAPPALRYRFWKLCEIIANEYLSQRQVPLLPPPARTVRPDGFRVREYWGGDSIHGNLDYGELVLQQIDALLAPPSG